MEGVGKSSEEAEGGKLKRNGCMRAGKDCVGEQDRREQLQCSLFHLWSLTDHEKKMASMC